MLPSINISIGKRIKAGNSIYYSMLLTLAGLYLMLDGLVSIAYYRNQSIPEHVPRLLRTGVGITLVALDSKKKRMYKFKKQHKYK